MKRADREMNEAFAWDVFDKAPYAVLSVTQADGTPYCVPVSPAREGTKVYFHCAPRGLKTDCIEADGRVCIASVSKAVPTLDKFTMEYESAIMFGRATTVTDDSERIEALRLICLRYTPTNMAHFDEAIERSLMCTRIVRIDVESITGKRKKYDPQGQEMKWGRME